MTKFNKSQLQPFKNLYLLSLSQYFRFKVRFPFSDRYGHKIHKNMESDNSTYYVIYSL